MTGAVRGAVTGPGPATAAVPAPGAGRRVAAAPDGGGGVEIRGLVKAFGATRAVDGIDISVPEGSFFALLGPSGCGKTTTLRMVAGLEEPTAGAIHIGGRDVAGTRPYQRPTNTVFQNYALFPHMTIFENVAFGLRRRKVGDVRRQVMEMLELVELTHLAQRKPAQLSGGQQQRIAVVRALVNRPKVLLLDEPLGALDLKLRRQMQLELKRIQTEVGITFIHVTHDQEEAMTMADTIAVMNLGRVEQLGAPVELYENPRTAFVAGFLGQSNLLAARVVARHGDVVELSAEGNRILMPAARLSVPGPDVEVGVRPEKVHLGDLGVAEEGWNRIDGTVVDASFIGVSTQYLVRTRQDEELTVFTQNLSTHLRRVGEQVTLSWRPEHTFGLETGAWERATAAETAS
ncbi:polyamine-transporting ATPase [Nakamurella endophytica]|uniref:Spermidine/putrescine import ATP-binding protein PotA n=1 Tax=Nakamurella endophytica TaxID=1748367 RepID=A0A917TBS6_9ACTN|nr:polyamine-transporting ATPase [Nakamurella endophytica]